MEEKLKMYFDDMAVYKDLKNSNCFSALSLPSFTRDWLLHKFENENGEFDTDELVGFVNRFIPKKEEWTAIKSRIVKDNERVRLLAKIFVDIDIKTGVVSFSLPDFGLSAKETLIEDSVWEDCKDELVSGHEVWGMIELGYRPPDVNARPNVRIRSILITIKMCVLSSRQKNGLMYYLELLIIMQTVTATKKKS